MFGYLCDRKIFIDMFPPIPSFQTSRLIAVAARPAMGKTPFLCALAQERSNQYPVLIKSLEYSEKQILNKLSYPVESILIDDAPHLSFQELESCVRDMVVTHRIKTVIIDYVNLIRDIEADAIFSALKSLAQELDIEIIAGVLVPRRQDGVKDPTVTLADLPMKGTEPIDEFIPLESQMQYCV